MKLYRIGSDFLEPGHQNLLESYKNMTKGACFCQKMQLLANTCVKSQNIVVFVFDKSVKVIHTCI